MNPLEHGRIIKKTGAEIHAEHPEVRRQIVADRHSPAKPIVSSDLISGISRVLVLTAYFQRFGPGTGPIEQASWKERAMKMFATDINFSTFINRQLVLIVEEIQKHGQS